MTPAVAPNAPSAPDVPDAPHAPPDDAVDRPLPGAGPVAGVVRARWRMFVVLPLAMMALAALFARFKPTTFTSSASFLPVAASRSGGALASLGAQFGIALPGNDASQSPAFYVDLLQSDVLLRQLLRRDYQADPSSPRRSLVELYEADGNTPAEREHDAIQELRKSISPGANARTGVVRVSVRAPSPFLAQQVATELLGALDRFNNERRRTGARTERQFVEARLGSVTGELRSAEDQLLSFRMRNLDYRSASPLRVEETRLERKVALYTQLQASLSQAYEQSRLDEVRDTPLISPVEAPSLPIGPDPKGFVRLMLTGAVLGLMLALAISLSRLALTPAGPPASSRG